MKDQNNQYVQLNNSGDMKAINIENYTVQNTLISKKAGNWRSFQLGKLNFDYSLINYWNVQ